MHPLPSLAARAWAEYRGPAHCAGAAGGATRGLSAGRPEAPTNQPAVRWVAWRRSAVAGLLMANLMQVAGLRSMLFPRTADDPPAEH